MFMGLLGLVAAGLLGFGGSKASGTQTAESVAEWGGGWLNSLVGLLGEPGQAVAGFLSENKDADIMNFIQRNSPTIAAGLAGLAIVPSWAKPIIGITTMVMLAVNGFSATGPFNAAARGAADIASLSFDNLDLSTVSAPGDPMGGASLFNAAGGELSSAGGSDAVLQNAAAVVEGLDNGTGAFDAQVQNQNLVVAGGEIIDADGPDDIGLDEELHHDDV